MSFSDVHQFLARKGTLANLLHLDRDGLFRTSAEIIYRAARQAMLSPKFLLALSQKEQSVIEDPAPTQKQLDWATGYGVCDGCRLDDPAVQRFKGFAKQILGAALQFREGYLQDIASRGRTAGGITINTPTTIDGERITPANRATAALYTYTPHLHGNKLFAEIWQRWFGGGFPDGVVVSPDSKNYWLITDGGKRHFTSRAVAYSRLGSGKEVVTVSLAELDRYPEGPDIKFANYTLARLPDGGIFLLVGALKRPIVSYEVFRRLGYNPEEVEDASPGDIAAYADGEPITIETVYPEGAVLKVKQTGDLYFVQDGKKHPLTATEILGYNFKGRSITAVSLDELAAYPLAEPVRFTDGALIQARGERTVYIVSRGTRRPIMNETAFKAFGWKWENIIRVPLQTLLAHPEGEPVEAPQNRKP